MANDFNHCTISGRVANEPEIRELPNGTNVADVTIISNRKHKDRDDAYFLELTFWGARADLVNKLVSKGDTIMATGYLVQSRWEKDGIKKSKVSINVEEFRVEKKNG